MSKRKDVPQEQNKKLLRALGIRHSVSDRNRRTTSANAGHAGDQQSSGGSNQDSFMHDMRQMDQMFEEWWQNRRNQGP